MKSFTKKILSAFIAGSFIFMGAAEVSAKENNHVPHEAEISAWTKSTAEWSGASETDIRNALKAGKHYNDIDIAAMLAKISGKSFNQVIAMKVDWFDVMKKLGITREKYEAAMIEHRMSNLAHDSELDIATVKSLMDEHYHPHDIRMAGIIAKIANKDVREVLNMRKINMRWIDVAEILNIDKNSIMQKEHIDENNEVKAK